MKTNLSYFCAFLLCLASSGTAQARSLEGLENVSLADAEIAVIDDVQACFEGCNKKFSAESAVCNTQDAVNQATCTACGGSWSTGILGGCWYPPNPYWIEVPSCMRAQCYKNAQNNFRACTAGCRPQVVAPSAPSLDSL